MPTSRSMAARGQSLLAFAPKVTKSACPCTPLHPAVLATGGRHWTSHGHDACASSIVRCSAATTARCSAPRRGLKGRFGPMLDRFAMRTTKTQMRASFPRSDHASARQWSAITLPMTRNGCAASKALLVEIPAAMTSAFHSAQPRPRAHVASSKGSAL